MRKIKFAIVGCGSIGKRHVAVVDAEKGAELVGICDIDRSKCKELSELYDNVPYFTDYTEMLASVEADVVNVVTPHALHAPMTVEACNSGFHVLVEKPMALTVERGKEMIEAAKKNNVNLWVVKQNRHNVPVKLAKEALHKKMLGEIFMVKCDILWNRYQGYYDDSPWRGVLKEEGGALFTQASHFIDLLIWWFGDVKKIHGTVATQNHKIETEDSGSIVMEFEKGTIGALNWTTCVFNKNYEGSITIVGESGTIKIGGAYLNKIEFWDVQGFPLQDGIDYSDKPNAYGKYQGTSSNHDKVIRSLVSRLQTNDGEMVDGDEGLKSIELIEDIYNKVRQY